MGAVPPDLPRLRSIDSELTRTIDRHDRTSSQLARTERDRQLATALLAEVMTRTREIRRERGTARLPGPGTDELAPQSAYGDDVDAALDRAEAVSRWCDRESPRSSDDHARMSRTTCGNNLPRAHT